MKRILSLLLIEICFITDSITKKTMKRETYFDFLRGIAIMMVVGIHTMPQVSGYNSIREDVVLVLRQIFNCAVPLFLAISGYFLAHKPLKNKEDIFAFWRKQIPRVCIPMVICGLGYFLLSVAKDSSLSNILIKTMMLLSGGFSIYYFVAVIIQCYIALPLLQSVSREGVFVGIIISFTAIIFTSYYINVEKYSFPLLLYAGPIYLWIVFFMLGVVMSRHPYKHYCNIGIIILIIGLILQISESDFLLRNYGKGIGIKLSSFIFSIGAILCLLSKQMQETFKSSKFTQIVAWIGEISFGVYLIHTYCILLFSRLITTNSWFTVWGISLLLTLVIIALMRRTIPSRICKRYFGF